MIHRLNRSQSGFTLLEMVIIVGIIGAMLGTYLSFYQPRQTAMASADTVLRMERVMNALSGYALRLNRLPCPARPNEDPSNTNFGAESTSGCTSTTPGAQGIVPFKTLGLMQDDVVDGFGRYFTYIVHGPTTDAPPNGPAGADITTKTSPVVVTGSDFCTLASGMTVRRRVGAALPTTEAGNVAVVLISHGADGYGAFNMSLTNFNNRNASNPIGTGGGSNALNDLTGENERENAVNNANTASTDIADYNVIVSPSTLHFDDKVMYMTLPGVISRLGVTVCH